MTYQIQKDLAASYRLDLLACINKAEKGLLSPSGQEYCFDEIEQLKETAEYPEDGNALFSQLRHTLSINFQISELAHETTDVSAFGGKLLFFYYIDRYTLMEITEQPHKGSYEGFVFISEKKHGTELRQIASEMKAELDRWVAYSNISLESIAASDHPNDSDFCFSNSLDNILTFLYTALQFPETVLT